MADAVIILTGAVLIGGVVVQMVRERRRTRYIDIRERIEPFVSPSRVAQR